METLTVAFKWLCAEIFCLGVALFGSRGYRFFVSKMDLALEYFNEELPQNPYAPPYASRSESLLSLSTVMGIASSFFCRNIGLRILMRRINAEEKDDARNCMRALSSFIDLCIVSTQRTFVVEDSVYKRYSRSINRSIRRLRNTQSQLNARIDSESNAGVFVEGLS